MAGLSGLTKTGKHSMSSYARTSKFEDDKKYAVFLSSHLVRMLITFELYANGNEQKRSHTCKGDESFVASKISVPKRLHAKADKKQNKMLETLEEQP